MSMQDNQQTESSGGRLSTRGATTETAVDQAVDQAADQARDQP
ncbi:hypothetical protein [Streptomyces sp. NPDC056296]